MHAILILQYKLNFAVLISLVYAELQDTVLRKGK